MKNFISSFALIAILLTFLFSIAVAENELVDKKCSTCHPVSTAYNKTSDQATWDATINKMKRYGLKMTEDEEKQIKEYLYTQK